MANKIFIISLLFMLSAYVHANINTVELTHLENTQDCGPLRHQVDSDPNDSSVQCLRIYFDNFAISSGLIGSTQRNCHMKATLRIPANTEFMASEAIAEGVYKMQGQSFGGLNLSYELSTNSSIGHWFESFRPNSLGDFTMTTKIETQAFTPCRPYETEVILNSDLHAYIDQRENGASLISLDESGNRLSWNWQVRPCIPDLFSAAFESYYSAPNGRRIRAIIDINNDRGSYATDANFTGYLYNITRSANGQVAEGEWSALNIHGRFRFQIINIKTGEFIGTWRDSHGRQGDWRGQYKN